MNSPLQYERKQQDSETRTETNLSELDGYLADAADAGEAVVRVVEGPQHLTEDVLEEHSVLPAGGGGEEGDEEGVSHDLSQGRRHPEACCETDLELQAYSGAVQIPAETSFSCPSCSTERTLSNLALAEQPSTLTKL